MKPYLFQTFIWKIKHSSTLIAQDGQLVKITHSFINDENGVGAWPSSALLVITLQDHNAVGQAPGGQASLGGLTKKWAPSDLSSVLCCSSPSCKIPEGPPPSPLNTFILFRISPEGLPHPSSSTLCSLQFQNPHPLSRPLAQPLLLSLGGNAYSSHGSHRLEFGRALSSHLCKVSWLGCIPKSLWCRIFLQAHPDPSFIPGAWLKRLRI